MLVSHDIIVISKVTVEIWEHNKIVTANILAILSNPLYSDTKPKLSTREMSVITIQCIGTLYACTTTVYMEGQR